LEPPPARLPRETNPPVATIIRLQQLVKAVADPSVPKRGHVQHLRFRQTTTILAAVLPDRTLLLLVPQAVLLPVVTIAVLLLVPPLLQAAVTHRGAAAEALHPEAEAVIRREAVVAAVVAVALRPVVAVAEGKMY